MIKSNTSKSLTHNGYNCKYRIVFAPKYRRKVIYSEKGTDIRESIKTLCEWKGEIYSKHIHLLLEITLKKSVSGFMGYLMRKKLV